MTRTLSLCAALLGAALAAAPLARPAAAQGRGGQTVWLLTKDGRSREAALRTRTLEFRVEGKPRAIAARDLLSLHLGGPASAAEAEKIRTDLPIVAGNDLKARQAAAEELVAIGIPVITPLLETYKDTDLHEPANAYRLFARLIPGEADEPDRTQDLIRLANGELLRGKLLSTELEISGEKGPEKLPASELRSLAVRQREIVRTLDVQALRHTTYVDWLDTGIAVSANSRFEESARGFTRLSFNIDGWASDPDGLKVPGPNYKTNLVDGFPFGALIGKVGSGGERWLAGKHVEKTLTRGGRLYLAVNDNPHWQNNIGSYHVKLKVTDAYDLGEAQ